MALATVGKEQGRVPFVGLRLQGNEEGPALLRLKLAQCRQAFLQVLVHPPQLGGGEVVPEGAVPHDEGGGLVRVVVPAGAEGAVGKLDAAPGKRLGRLALVGVERRDPAVGVVQVGPRCYHCQAQARRVQGIGDVRRILLVILVVVVQLHAQLDVLGQARRHFILHQTDEVDGVELVGPPGWADAARDESARALVEGPAAEAVERRVGHGQVGRLSW